MPRLQIPGLLMALLLAGAPVCSAQDAPGKKFAVLIGVKEYKHSGFSNLYYTERDATELASVLKPAGFEVVVLCDTTGKNDEKLLPTKANILAQLDKVLDQCGRNDMVLFGFAGHGVQFKDEDKKSKGSYFCPYDAHPFKADSMISFKALYDKLEECGAGIKLVMVDACRVEVDKERFRSGVDGDNAPPPPKGVSVLFSCKSGQAALELNDLRHGLFFYHVVQGLKGEAKNRKGNITWQGLAEYAAQSVLDSGFRQVPVLKGEIEGLPVLVAVSQPTPKVEVPQPKVEVPAPKVEVKKTPDEKPTEPMPNIAKPARPVNGELAKLTSMQATFQDLLRTDKRRTGTIEVGLWIMSPLTVDDLEELKSLSSLINKGEVRIRGVSSPIEAVRASAKSVIGESLVFEDSRNLMDDKLPDALILFGGLRTQNVPEVAALPDYAKLSILEMIEIATCWTCQSDKDCLVATSSTDTMEWKPLIGSNASSNAYLCSFKCNQRIWLGEPGNNHYEAFFEAVRNKSNSGTRSIQKVARPKKK